MIKLTNLLTEAPKPKKINVDITIKYFFNKKRSFLKIKPFSFKLKFAMKKAKRRIYAIRFPS